MAVADFRVTAFKHRDLKALEKSLDPDLLKWADRSPLVRSSESGHRLIRDLAAIHSIGKVAFARARLNDFKMAVMLGLDMSTPSRELRGDPPMERAGATAAYLATAKLITKWYALEQDDFARLPLLPNVTDIPSATAAGLHTAICVKPHELGITSFTDRDVFLATTSRVQDQVVAWGPAALGPYLEFPEYPYPIE